jgi:polyhydroxybutyrate depolymerase
VTRLIYRGCRDGVEVVIYRVERGGHTWPGSGLRLPAEQFGATTEELDATGMIGDFFAAHR